MMPEAPRPRRCSVWIDRLLTAPQHLLPHHALSRLVGRATRLRSPLIRDLMIRSFVWLYGVDLGDALSADPAAYADFNAFFTRALAANARPLPGDPEAIACPVDGTISQIGTLDGSALVQAKGRTCSLQALLGGRSDVAADFDGGSFVTLYLAPHNYHRIHMPVRGTLAEVIYVPGTLFSVSERATRRIDRLFARNERVISIFDAGGTRTGLVMVGAMFVGSMELTVCDLHAVARRRTAAQAVSVPIGAHTRTLERGAEIGRFNMGSTVIVLFPRDAARWRGDLAPGEPLRMGQEIGRLTG